MAAPRPAEHPIWIRPQGDCRNTGALDRGLKKERNLWNYQFPAVLGETVIEFK